jgi:hypothetical protein
MAFRRSGNGDAASIPDQRQYRFGTADQFDQVLIRRAPAYRFRLRQGGFTTVITAEMAASHLSQTTVSA